MKSGEAASPARPRSLEVFRHNQDFIPGGVVSGVRKVEPEIAFCRAAGAHMWDVDGCRYLDYHAAFAPHLLGHNDPQVNQAVIRVLEEGMSLFGTGTNELEGRLAAQLCRHIPALERVEFLNTGTEASMAALRLARAATGRDHLIVMQGGFNGSHNDVACNVLTPLEEIGPRVSPGEYRCVPIGSGVPAAHRALIHVVNFNDLDSVEYVCRRHPVAALITEPILQNIGVVKPLPGYLQGLRELADRHGFLLVFDEVKTGFRYGLGGYSEISGVRPDLLILAKAMANGFPISALGGRNDLMDLFADPDPNRRPLAAGTYNGHPVGLAAALATLERLREGDGAIYRYLESVGARMQQGIEDLLQRHRTTGVVARQGSAFCLYFMDHEPRDWHDLAGHHDFAKDLALRRALIDRGIYFFPVATKQCSLSAAHSEEDVDLTLEMLDQTLPLV